MFCERCGQQISEEAHYCKHCGAQLVAWAGAESRSSVFTEVQSSTSDTGSDAEVTSTLARQPRTELSKPASGLNLIYLLVLFFASLNLIHLYAVFPVIAAAIPLRVIKNRVASYVTSICSYTVVHLVCVAIVQSGGPGQVLSVIGDRLSSSSQAPSSRTSAVSRPSPAASSALPAASSIIRARQAGTSNERAIQEISAALQAPSSGDVPAPPDCSTVRIQSLRYEAQAAKKEARDSTHFLGSPAERAEQAVDEAMASVKEAQLTGALLDCGLPLDSD